MRVRRLFPLLLVAAAGCDAVVPDPADDPLANVIGEYQASRLVVADPDNRTDVLELGGAFTLAVLPDGLFTSRLTLPAGTVFSRAGALDITVNGRVEVRLGGTLTFVHDEDYFLRDLRWTFRDGSIRSDKTARPTTRTSYDIVLAR